MDVYFDDFFVYCTLAQKYVIFVDKKWLLSHEIHILKDYNRLRNWTFWKKLKVKKTQNSRKKLNNSSKKLKVLANFEDRLTKNIWNGHKNWLCSPNLWEIFQNSRKNSKLKKKPSKLKQKSQNFSNKTQNFISKNSKLKQKTQGFGKFIWSSCRKQVQIRSLD